MKYMPITLAVILNGFSTPLLKYIATVVPIYPVILIRGLVSLFCLRGVSGNSCSVKTKREKAYYITLGILSIIGFYTYYTALMTVNVGLIAVFTINGTMFVTLVLSGVLLGERYSLVQYVSISMGLLCLTLLTVSTIGFTFNFGIILLVINVIVNAFSGYLITLLLRTRESKEVTFFRISIDIILCFIILVINPVLIKVFITNLPFWLVLAILYLGVNSVIMGLMTNKSIQNIGLSMTEVLKNFTVVITIVVGVIFMGESYSFTQLGLLVIFIITVFCLVLTKNETFVTLLKVKQKGVSSEITVEKVV